MHVAFAQECIVHSEGSGKFVMCMTASLLCILQVILQHRTIVGMCHLDEFLCFLHVALVTKVSHTILRNDCIYVVIRMIYVTCEGNDAGDSASLCGRTASKDGEIGICGEVCCGWT